MTLVAVYVMSCYVMSCPHNNTPRLHPFVSMTLYNTAYYLIQCTSALTGKVDKEKQKRDLEIINAARENNIFNLSLPSHTSPPPPATSLRCVVLLSCLRVWCFSLASVCGVSLLPPCVVFLSCNCPASSLSSHTCWVQSHNIECSASHPYSANLVTFSHTLSAVLLLCLDCL